MYAIRSYYADLCLENSFSQWSQPSLACLQFFDLSAQVCGIGIFIGDRRVCIDQVELIFGLDKPLGNEDIVLDYLLASRAIP